MFSPEVIRLVAKLEGEEKRLSAGSSQRHAAAFYCSTRFHSHRHQQRRHLRYPLFHPRHPQSRFVFFCAKTMFCSLIRRPRVDKWGSGSPWSLTLFNRLSVFETVSLPGKWGRIFLLITAFFTTLRKKKVAPKFRFKHIKVPKWCVSC